MPKLKPRTAAEKTYSDPIVPFKPRGNGLAISGPTLLPDNEASRKFLDSLKRETMPQNVLYGKVRGWALQHDPVAGMPRMFAVLDRLYQMSVAGDIDAMKLFIDRILGKQTESLAIAVGAFDSLDNNQLMSAIGKAAIVAQSPSESENDVKPDEI